MKRTLLAAIVLASIGLGFVAGAWFTGRRPSDAATPTAERRILHYTCPMHPAYHSDRPGECPSCGMRLEPSYAEETVVGATPAELARLVRVSAERQQMIGVRVGTAEETSTQRVIRTVGRVTPNETLLYRVIAATEGWIQDVTADSKGSRVRKDQLLAFFYAPEFLSAEQAYVYALASFDRFVATGKETPEQLALTKASIQQAADTLRNMGMSETQLAEIARRRDLPQRIGIRSPADGVMLERNVSPGQRFEKGTELYRIADLADVWVLADVFESQAVAVKPGATARVIARQLQRQFQARVSNVESLFDEASRTIKVRLEMRNPGYALKPGMFVDVDLPVNLPSAVTVPAEAVLDSGLRKVVFVDRGNGYFEPRRVETGWQVGDRLEIARGLMPGERIVISGNFLLDSEARMRVAAATSDASAATVDPVCGMAVDPKPAVAAGRLATHQGRAFYFCSDDCKKQFAEHPEKFAAQ